MIVLFEYTPTATLASFRNDLYIGYLSLVFVAIATKILF